MDESTREHIHLEVSLGMDKSTLEQLHIKVSVAMEKSMLQQVHLVVSMSVNKAMPQYLEASVAMNKTTTQQLSEGAVGNGKGRTRAGTPCVTCVIVAVDQTMQQQIHL